MITQSKHELRLATIGDATGNEAYIALIQFDEELCSDYNGFQTACDRIGLSYPTLRQYEEFWRVIEESDC